MQPSFEIALRIAAYAAVFASLAVWEIWWPRRALEVGRKPRWPNNLGILVIDAMAVRLLIPVAAVGAAMFADGRGWGLFNLADLPLWLRAVLGFVLLDLVIYGQHFAFHHVPLLWRLHRMHHSDLDVDVTTGVRFHPIEILLSMLLKIAVVMAVGIPAVSVLVFEIVLNATAMFNHANIALSPALDRWLRLVVVTPDMHRVHHSILREETDSNFGFNLPWWDHLFGTYRGQPRAGHLGVTLGIPIFRERAESRLDRLLSQPFRTPKVAEGGAPPAAGGQKRTTGNRSAGD
jgi:sterol desaturase/sphingolipid hydroxylase (fatty acid hydroxylase superfamily)